jgi:hypothetical protein
MTNYASYSLNNSLFMEVLQCLAISHGTNPGQCQAWYVAGS